MCDSSFDDGMLPNCSYPSTCSPLNRLGFHEGLRSIPFFASTSTSYVLSVVDCLQAMSCALHTTFELCFLDYNRYLIQKLPFVPIKFNSDVFSWTSSTWEPGRENLGQMQGMDKKFDSHAWRKVKMVNIKKWFQSCFPQGLMLKTFAML